MKSYVKILKTIRNTWNMNPITRVHDKNKKRKENQKKQVRNIMKEYDGE
jgi:hypothetical protein